MLLGTVAIVLYSFRLLILNIRVCSWSPQMLCILHIYIYGVLNLIVIVTALFASPCPGPPHIYMHVHLGA